MTTQQLVIVVAAFAAVGILAVFNSGRRHAHRGVDGMRHVGRASGTAFRALVTAAVIVGVVWFVVAKLGDNTTAVLVALGVPALFAGASIARTLAGTEVVHTGHRGRGGW